VFAVLSIIPATYVCGFFHFIDAVGWVQKWCLIWYLAYKKPAPPILTGIFEQLKEEN